MSDSAARTQRSAVITKFGEDLVLKTQGSVKQPSTLKPGECLIKLDYAGVCHSDIHAKKGDWLSQPTLPRVGGHEGVGHVVAIGEHSLDPPVEVGDRVGLKWVATACLKCEMCRKGFEIHCPASKVNGYTTDGTFADYIVSDVNYVTPVPDGLASDAAASILCAGITVYKALKQTNTIIGDWVVVPGAGGGLGHLCVQYAVAMGLRVVAIDTGEEKKNLVLELGAERWIDFQESKNIVTDVVAATGTVGPHAAVVAANAGAPFNQACMYVRPTGTVVAVGIPAGAFLNVPIGVIVGKSIKIVGSAVGNRQDAVEALDIAARGKVKVRFETKKFEDINKIFAAMENGKVAGRIVVKL